MEVGDEEEEDEGKNSDVSDRANNATFPSAASQAATRGNSDGPGDRYVTTASPQSAAAADDEVAAGAGVQQECWPHGLRWRKNQEWVRESDDSVWWVGCSPRWSRGDRSRPSRNTAETRAAAGLAGSVQRLHPVPGGSGVQRCAEGELGQVGSKTTRCMKTQVRLGRGDLGEDVVVAVDDISSECFGLVALFSASSVGLNNNNDFDELSRGGEQNGSEQQQQTSSVGLSPPRSSSSPRGGSA